MVVAVSFLAAAAAALAWQGLPSFHLLIANIPSDSLSIFMHTNTQYQPTNQPINQSPPKTITQVMVDEVRRKTGADFRVAEKVKTIHI
jgi:hypothetical protein